MRTSAQCNRQDDFQLTFDRTEDILGCAGRLPEAFNARPSGLRSLSDGAPGYMFSATSPTKMATQNPTPITDAAQSDRIAHAVFEHAARISRVQDVSGLMSLNADFACDLVGAERCSLWLLDENSRELWTMVAHGLDPIRIPAGQGLVGACVNGDEVVRVNDLAEEPRFLRRVDMGSGFHTREVLCVPLRVDQRVIGAIQLLNKVGGFTDADAELVGLLGHFAASAIESESLRQKAAGAQMVLHELSLAREVQARLMPQQRPHVRGIECTGFCRPARVVGGDYYDFLDLDDGRFAFTLGDVSGKGIPAAVMMASIQTLLRSLLRYENRGLWATVSELNRTLYDSSTEERYSTLFCGVLNEERTRLTYVNAGHVRPLVLRADGTLSELSGADVPVGMLPGIQYRQWSTDVAPGDVFVVVSDGVTEVCNAGGEFWNELQVHQIVRDHGPRPIAELPSVLCADADSFAAGADQYDDMTVIAVRVL